MSSLSAVTSCSSQSSVEFYKEKLEPAIKAVGKSRTLQDLVCDAEKIVKERFAPDSRSTFKCKKDREIFVQLDQIMLAMLTCAEECGGESGKRYVASAIWACSIQEDVVGALEALGTTWLTHLLFVFKISRGHRNQPNRQVSGLATPTIDNTVTHLLDGVGDREKSFQKNVLQRDGYTCIITGYQDSSHPKLDASVPNDIELAAAHILRRAIGEFDSSPNSESFNSAAATFDILVNFTHLPTKTLQELYRQLDNPSNGITLEYYAHNAYDKFHWCLKATETEHVYDMKFFKDRTMLQLNILRKPEKSRISFKDHSNDFLADTTRRRKPSVPLPSPHYIAIHAAIAGILNMSGAGKFFDELLDQYKDDEGNVPAVRSWPELETLMEEQSQRESIFEAFGSIKAH